MQSRFDAYDVHAFDSDSDGQEPPQYAGDVILRVRVVVPEPHRLEHCDQLDQALTEQSRDEYCEHEVDWLRDGHDVPPHWFGRDTERDLVLKQSGEFPRSNVDCRLLLTRAAVARTRAPAAPTVHRAVHRATARRTADRLTGRVRRARRTAAAAAHRHASRTSQRSAAALSVIRATRTRRPTVHLNAMHEAIKDRKTTTFRT